MATYDITSALLNPSSFRKKKKYALILYAAKAVGETDIRTLERATASALSELTIIRMCDPDEALKAMIVKNIEIVIMHHSFFNDDNIAVHYAAELKKRKKCPIFFTTMNEKNLIAYYREFLFAYEETDDYLLSPVDFNESVQRIKKTMSFRSRTAKRFIIDAPIEIYELNNDTKCEGRLFDLSLIGYGLILDEPKPLTRQDQIQIQIPLQQYGIFHPQYGDFLRLAGRVQRISIEGKKIGCSAEYVTPMQNDCLIKILTVLSKRARAARANLVRKKVKSH